MKTNSWRDIMKILLLIFNIFLTLPAVCEAYYHRRPQVLPEGLQDFLLIVIAITALVASDHPFETVAGFIKAILFMLACAVGFFIIFYLLNSFLDKGLAVFIAFVLAEYILHKMSKKEQ